MQTVTTQISTNQPNITQTTTIYPNDVTWESVGKYVHLFNQCWEYIAPVGHRRGYEPEMCNFNNDKNVADLGVTYPCSALKEELSVNIQKTQQLNDYICPRSDVVKDFDKKVTSYEHYDNTDYVHNLLISGTVITAGTVLVSLVGAFGASMDKVDTTDTEGVSCPAKYWLALSMLAGAVVPLITMGISSAALANDGLPWGGKDCIAYHLLQDMGQLAHNVTGIDYL